MVLMFVAVVAWLQFFGPKPPEPQEAAPATEQASETTEFGQPAGADAADATEEAGDVPAATPTATTTPEADGGGLPAPVTEVDPATDHVQLDDEYLALTFSRVGARLVKAKIKLGPEGRDSIQLVPQPPEDVPEAEAAYPFGLQFASNYLGTALNSRRWEAKVSDSRDAVTFSFDLPDGGRVSKTVRLNESPRVIDATVNYTNGSGKTQVLGVDTIEPAYSLYWAPNVDSQDEARGWPKNSSGGATARTIISTRPTSSRRRAPLRFRNGR